LKLITLFLIHLVKKQAVLKDEKAKGLKPISFVKVKDETTYTQKVYEYIKYDLANDITNIEIIIDKVGQQDLEIVNLIKDLLSTTYNNDLKLLTKDLQYIANTTIFYHGKSDKD